MKKTILFFLLIGALIADDWVYEKSSDGVIAYTRKTADSSFKEYKVETDVDARLSQVVAVLMAVKDMPEWVDRCAEANIINEISPTESISRSVSAAPFPLKNREAVAHGKLTQDPKTHIVRLVSTGRANALPENSKYQRVKDVRGYWELSPKPGGKVHIKMIGHTDPGGVIPAALANHFVVTIPFNSIRNLRKQIKKEKYAKAKLAFIVD